MRPRAYTFRAPSNALLQAAYFIVGGIVLIGVVLMGAVLLAVGLGLAAIIVTVLFVRTWWSGRIRAPAARGPAPGGELLEVEYSVVEERDERDSGKR
jgi:hypothetical protein